MLSRFAALAVSLTSKASLLQDEAGDSDSSSISDIFSLIGTVFLWLYWPSFVTAMPGDSAQETTALLNTVFALLGSAVTTFGISAWMESEYSNGRLGL